MISVVGITDHMTVYEMSLLCRLCAKLDELALIALAFAVSQFATQRLLELVSKWVLLAPCCCPTA